MRRLFQIAVALEFAIRGAGRVFGRAVDVVFAAGLWNLFHGLLVKMVKAAPLILSLHGMNELERVQRSMLLRKVISRWVDAILVISPAMLPLALELFPELRVGFRPSGVDLNLFHPVVSELPKRYDFVSVGTHKWHKDYPSLFAALALVRKDFPRIRCAIVGMGPLLREHKRLVVDLGIDDAVDFIEVLGQGEIANLLGSARYFVLASVSEGTPKVVLEALACGIPVIVSKACNLDVVSEGAGAEFEPRDIDEMALAMSKLLRLGEKKYMRMSGKAMSFSSRYAWPKVAEQEDLFVAEVCKSSRKG